MRPPRSHRGLFAPSALILILLACCPARAEELLTKTNGGRSITPAALKEGDVLISTTRKLPSIVIRAATNSTVSHAIVYIGQFGTMKDAVVEAVGTGVRIVELPAALSDASLAIVLRPRNLSAVQSVTLTAFLAQQKGKQYNLWGAITNPRVTVGSALALLQVALGEGDAAANKFYCSELVVTAFDQVGIQVVPNWATARTSLPADLKDAAVFPASLGGSQLVYIGHLK